MTPPTYPDALRKANRVSDWEFRRCCTEVRPLRIAAKTDRLPVLWFFPITGEVLAPADPPRL